MEQMPSLKVAWTLTLLCRAGKWVCSDQGILSCMAVSFPSACNTHHSHHIFNSLRAADNQKGKERRKESKNTGYSVLKNTCDMEPCSDTSTCKPASWLQDALSRERREQWKWPELWVRSPTVWEQTAGIWECPAHYNQLRHLAGRYSGQPTFWQKAEHKTSPSLVFPGIHYWHLMRSALPNFSLHMW